METKPKLTEEAGYEALRGHCVEKALVARARYGPVIDGDAIRRVLADTDIVRFPVELRFGAEELLPGEFAWAKPKGASPAEGFELVVHPAFEGHDDALPLLVAYHVVAINYLDVATHTEAEHFGAALFGLPVDDYYTEVCRIVDGVFGEPAPLPADPFGILSAGSACSSASPVPAVGPGGPGGPGSTGGAGACSGSC